MNNAFFFYPFALCKLYIIMLPDMQNKPVNDAMAEPSFLS
jgi:hypothetical protein